MASEKARLPDEHAGMPTALGGMVGKQDLVREHNTHTRTEVDDAILTRCVVIWVGMPGLLACTCTRVHARIYTETGWCPQVYVAPAWPGRGCLACGAWWWGLPHLNSNWQANEEPGRSRPPLCNRELRDGLPAGWRPRSSQPCHTHSLAAWSLCQEGWGLYVVGSTGIGPAAAARKHRKFV